MPAKRPVAPSGTPKKLPDNIQTGSISESAVAHHLVRKGWIVYTMEFRTAGPIDMAAMHPETQTWLLIDVKTDTSRKSKRSRAPSRIYRKRTDLQEQLGVILAYVNSKGRITWRPKLPTAIANLV
jgi:Holliday junction resolvase-like predicted endonuclease